MTLAKLVNKVEHRDKPSLISSSQKHKAQSQVEEGLDRQGLSSVRLLN